MGEKGGMQLNKHEVLGIVVYVQLWAQRFVLHLLLHRDDFVGFCTSMCLVTVAHPTVNLLYSVNLNGMQVLDWLLHCIL